MWFLVFFSRLISFIVLLLWVLNGWLLVLFMVLKFICFSFMLVGMKLVCCVILKICWKCRVWCWLMKYSMWLVCSMLC